MRVLFVSGLTGFGAGGVQTEMVRLIGGAGSRGVDVAVTIDHLPGRLSDVRHFPLTYPPTADAGAQVRSAVDAFAPDCVHVIGGGLQLLRAVDGLRLTVPWVFTAHNLPPYERISTVLPGHNRLHYDVRNLRALPAVLAWRRFVARGSFARVIAHSTVVAHHLTAFGCPAAKVVTIPFGCDPARPAESKAPPGAGRPRVLTVAGLAHHKGIHDYIAAVARLGADFPQLTYRVIGQPRDKVYAAFLRQRIAALGLGERVTLLEGVTDDGIRGELAAADLYVQPSHEEGFCLAFAEAAMVVPRLIGCRTGEIAGLADGDPTARVIEPKDVAALAGATRELMAVEASPATVAARVVRLLARYSWDAYLDRHLDLFSRPA